MTEGANRLILFTLQGERYALGLEEVAEVMEPPPIYPIPRAPHCFAGIMNSHGNLVSVIDLALLLNNTPRSPHGQLLVLDTRVANLALWADSVESVHPAEIINDECEGIGGIVEGVLKISGREVKRLSVEKLLLELEKVLLEAGRNGGGY
jgi:chemotaxis signal transduction protein